MFWDKVSRGFSIDASDIRGWRPGDDITVTNSLTGGIVIYSGRPYEEKRDADNDIQFWKLKGYKGTTLTIFND